jgi:hypothetical protein
MVSRLISAGASASTAAPTSGRIVDPIPGWQRSVTSGFGPRVSPTGGGGTEFHHGIDIGKPMGTPIQAVKDGKVVFAGANGGFGNLVVLQHNDGTFSLYAHQSALNVQVGQDVKAGDVIGKVGSTGRSTGAHLHFEVRKGAQWGSAAAIDPVAYLNGSIQLAANDPGPGRSFSGGSNSGGSVSRGDRNSTGGGGGSSSELGLSGASSPGPSSSAGTSMPSVGSSVAKGDFKSLMAELAAMGIDLAYLQELAKKYGVPLDMILAIIMQESGGDPNAKSAAGAEGLMQLMPATAAGLGVSNPLDPKQNVEAGVKYLSQLHGMARSGGDWTNVAGMYNAGPAGSFSNPETANYMSSVPQLRQQAQAAAAAA